MKCGIYVYTHRHTHTHYLTIKKTDLIKHAL